MKRRQNMFNDSSTRLIFRYQLSSILARHSSPSQQIRRMSPIRFKFLGRHRKQEPDMPSGLNIFLGFFGLLCLFLAEQNKTSVSTAKGLAQFVISTKLPHSTFVTVPGKIRCNGWNPAISKKKKNHFRSIKLSLKTKTTFIQSRSPRRQRNYYGILKRQLKPNPFSFITGIITS